jgi:MFS family permease
LITGPTYLISQAIGGLITGSLIDKTNRKNVLVTLGILWSLSSIVSGNCDSLLVLVAMRFLLGFAGSVDDPAISSILGDYFP